jgi:hypothetical protein
VSIIEKEYMELIDLYDVQLSEETNKMAEKIEAKKVECDKPKTNSIEKKDKDDKFEKIPDPFKEEVK